MARTPCEARLQSALSVCNFACSCMVAGTFIRTQFKIGHIAQALINLPHLFQCYTAEYAIEIQTEQK